MVIVVALIRIYSGWSYIGARLTSKIIEYEESGWYDGDFERKSQQEQLRDELLYEEKVKPVVDRLKLFSFGAGALWIASCAGFKVAQSIKPKFDEYNPASGKDSSLKDKMRNFMRSISIALGRSRNNVEFLDERDQRK